MLISTEINSFRRFGTDKEVIKMLKESGFTAYDFSMTSGAGIELLKSDDYIEKAKDLRAFADSIGIPCNQTHAPFATARKGNEEYNKKMFPQIVRALEISAILGAKICVVHPCNDYTPEENAVMYKPFEEVAKKVGIKIATENMWNWPKGSEYCTPAACSTPESFIKHIDIVNDPYLVACLDIGHAEMKGSTTSAVELIHALGKRLECLHVHDNDKRLDSHELPFTMDIDFVPIMQALKDIGYNGWLTLEAWQHKNNGTREETIEIIKKAAASANRLNDIYESLK